MRRQFLLKKLTKVNCYIYRSVWIFGGLSDTFSYSNFQTFIDDINKSSSDKVLLKNIKYSDVCFNLYTTQVVQNGPYTVVNG
jgi:hypothetical protein